MCCSFVRLLECFGLVHLLDAIEHDFETVGEDQQVRVPEGPGVLESALLLAVGPLAGDGVDRAVARLMAAVNK
jgi:hypothetical protein